MKKRFRIPKAAPVGDAKLVPLAVHAALKAQRDELLGVLQGRTNLIIGLMMDASGNAGLAKPAKAIKVFRTADLASYVGYVLTVSLQEEAGTVTLTLEAPKTNGATKRIEVVGPDALRKLPRVM
jgi:hypothetical protein